MPHPEPVRIDVSDIGLTAPDGSEVTVGQLPGVQAVVLLRHRH